MLTPTTLRVSCSCPCCGDEGPRIISFLVEAPRTSLVNDASDTTSLPVGSHPAQVSSCLPCTQHWSAGLDAARETLRVRGELERLPGQQGDSWQGVAVCGEGPDARDASDALEDAVLAEMSILGLSAPRPENSQVLVTVKVGSISLSRVHVGEAEPALSL